MNAVELGAGYPMQTIKLPLPLPVEMLPHWLLELTHEVYYRQHQDPLIGYEAIVCFKPETHAQILRAEIFVIEVAKICEEERQKQQQDQGGNHE